jgi:DNA polymerase III sliding clamp (beta) subunit (PCNA family)
MQIAIDPRILRRAQACVIKDEARPYLTGVWLLNNPTRVAATNGHILYEAKPDEHHGATTNTMIVFKRKIPLRIVEHVREIIIDINDLKGGEHPPMYGVIQSPAMQWADLVEAWPENHAGVLGGGFSCPNYSKIIPKEESLGRVSEVGLHPKYLSTFCEVYPDGMKLFFSKESREPIIVKSYGDDHGIDDLGLIMPMSK